MSLTSEAQNERIMRATEMAEGALLGTESRRGIWTDRDYLVHILAILTDSDRARTAAITKPVALLDANKPLKHKDEPWWWQYENMATNLEAAGPDAIKGIPLSMSMLSLAADDIRTLVQGLRDLERKLDQVDGPDPSMAGLCSRCGKPWEDHYTHGAKFKMGPFGTFDLKADHTPFVPGVHSES